MQQVPLTLLALAATVSTLLLLRSRWRRLGHAPRRLVLILSVFAMLLFAGGRALGWTTSSERLNSALYWAAIIGYLLLLTVHSLNRPVWLTSTSAIVLALPILGASLILPLGDLFFPKPCRVQPLGDHLYVSWQPFTEVGTSTTGANVDIFYRPPLLPFLQHSRLAGRFYDARCNASGTIVTMQPDRKSVFVHCPPWPGSSGDVDPPEILPLH